MQKVFDITNAGGEWLCQEDKDLYYRQIQSDGRVGYTTQKLAPASTIHPSKKRKIPKPNDFPSTSIQGANNFSSESETESTSSISESTASEDTSDTEPASKRSSTSGATKMVIRHSMSTYKAAAVCSTLAEEGVTLSTPSQSGVWRSVLRKGEKEREKIKVILQQEKNYCLHFDGKKLSNSEYQVVCLQSQSREIKLGILKCSSGSAQHIYNQLEQILDEYIAWSCIKMIICDTTAVNIGRVNGVVVKLQKKMAEMGLERPQYIGCQHHILDRILKHVLDFYISKHSTKPNLSYEFVEEITKNYESLQELYHGDSNVEITRNPGWRDDFKFLYELCKAFQFHKVSEKLIPQNRLVGFVIKRIFYLQEHGIFPIIKWRKLPSLHNARWNSRAICLLMSYFLLPNWRDSLAIPAQFVSYGWQKAWFSDQKYSESAHGDLLKAVTEINVSIKID